MVAIKAELAGRLIEVDRDRAAAEIAEVEALARAALADVRQTVGAYREVSLAAELAGARSALAAAGIAADLPAEVPELPEEWDRLFGWAVREGVTNVVRHSGARCCVIRVHPDRVEISDDGRGPSTPDAERARAGRPAGAGAAAGRRGDRRPAAGRASGFLLRVHAPAEAR